MDHSGIRMTTNNNNNNNNNLLYNPMTTTSSSTNNNIGSESQITLTCIHCNYPGSEVRLSCGCTLHSRCIPIQLLAVPGRTGGFDMSGEDGNQQQQQQQQANQPMLPRLPHSMICPFCHISTIQGFEMLPMTIDLLDRAVEAKRKSAPESSKPKSISSVVVNSGGTSSSVVQQQQQLPGENSLNEIQAESTYLIVNHSASNSANGGGGGNVLGSTTDCYRTGRWTEEEMEFVDHLIDAFDRGILPVLIGVRLNDFLCSLLLCKASRLTKKMKNAKLSVRAYALDPRETTPSLDVKTLSKLQEKFLNSIQEDHARYELRFNMEKSWRTNLSNLCVQIGSTLCNATAWFTSLEMMDNRAAQAYENIRKARRYQMGLALKTDIGASNGVYFSDIPVQQQKKLSGQKRVKKEKAAKSPECVDDGSRDESNRSQNSQQMQQQQNTHISNMLDVGEIYDNNKDTMDDYAGLFNDLLNDIPSHIRPRGTSNENGSFLDEVLTYVEEHNLPFSHIDVWVPSFIPQSVGNDGSAVESSLRLYHAGCCTRSDVNAFVFLQLKEYGEYSTKFSFGVGVGLPGRVYQNGQPSWERHIDEADPKIFERAGGAKVYGIKTGVGIPIDVNSSIRRIIVALYSQSDIETDHEMMRRITEDLQMFCPKPKWKLIVEMGSELHSKDNHSDTVRSTNHDHEGPSPSFDPVGGDTDDVSTLPNELNHAYHHQGSSNSGNSHTQPQIIHYDHQKGNIMNNNNNNSLNHSRIPNSVTVEPIHSNTDGDVLHYHHGVAVNAPLQQRNRASSTASLHVPSTSTNVARIRSGSNGSNHSESYSSESKRDEEIRIAALLGDHMPGAELPTAGEPSGSVSNVPSGNVPLAHYMSLRLLLLRAPERRTEDENALLDIIKRSYRGFSRDGNRSEKEIGNLLARDWQFLRSTLPPPLATNKPSVAEVSDPSARSHSDSMTSFSVQSPQTCTNVYPLASSTMNSSLQQLPLVSLHQQQYQSFVMNAPVNVSTSSGTGAPISMPPLRLGYNANSNSNTVADNNNNNSKNLSTTASNIDVPSLDNDGMQKKQRIE